jgi:hypothetical protein
VRDEQVRRYARHILLPDVGGLGQTALLTAAARVTISREPEADLIAATYLAAGGVGTLLVPGATDDEIAALAKAGPDAHVSSNGHATGHATDVELDGRPAWWPSTDDDATALAFWRGAAAATRWMAAVASR